MPNPSKHNVNAIAYAHLIAGLLDGGTVYELVERCGLNYYTVIKLIRALQTIKSVHVEAWERDSLGRFTKRVFVLGPGKDAPRPKMSNAEKCKRYYTKCQQVSAATGTPVGKARVKGMRRNVFGLLEAA